MNVYFRSARWSMRRRDDEKEKRIKEALVQLILEEGWNGASMSKIAKTAGVSPSTVYVYFDSKEDMLQCTYREYSEDVYDCLMNDVSDDMGPGEILEELIRGYYQYILDHPEIFCFVEQFSGSPALASCCQGKQRVCDIEAVIEKLREAGQIQDYSNDVLYAAIFYPVKAIATNNHRTEKERDHLLDELIEFDKYAILK